MLSQPHIIELLHRYGYGVVAGVVGLESMGIPLPGETVLLAAALYAAATHQIDIVWVVAAACLGAILGDNAGFAIGRSFGAPLLSRLGPHVGLSQQRLRLGQYLFQLHGNKVVFFGRFVALLRTFAALLAGANRMPWPHFLLWNALGGIAWASLYGFGAYFLGNEVLKLAGPVGIALGVAAAIALAIGVVFLKRHEARLEADAERALAAREAEAARHAPHKRRIRQT